MKSGHTDTDPAHTGFQFIEDIACAYWYSQVLFSALELNLFGHLEKKPCTADTLAENAGCRAEPLLRMLYAMTRMGLVQEFDSFFCNTQVTSLFLVPGKPEYMGEFFLYRKYMQPRWEELTDRVRLTPLPEPEALSYEERNFRYVAAMDTLICQKAPQIAGIVAKEAVKESVIDIGGGAGSLIRAIQNKIPGLSGVLFDIPEVVDAAGRIYPDESQWQRIQKMAGDFRSHTFDQTYSLVCMGNFLHAYGRQEAEEIFKKAAGLAARDGLSLIHDYFPDRKGVCPQKGALYDLSMMLNTYNGTCHTSETVIQWCKNAGFNTVAVQDLDSDTSLILASRNGPLHLKGDPVRDAAEQMGFDQVLPIRADQVTLAAWARQKCRFGCELYGKGLQCPPRGMDYPTTCEMLAQYSKGYLLRGAPPGKEFHTRLLGLEKTAFLKGFHKAFVFGAGPCTVCPSCPNDDTCRFPHLARPSMEGSGIDVYETAKNAGLKLSPVQKKGQYVSYIGLLLLE